MRALLAVLLLSLPVLADWQERFRRGEALLTQGKAEDAQRDLLTALRQAETVAQQGPALGAILDALGRAEFQLDNYRTAVQCFERSLAIWLPRSEAQAMALYNIGRARHAMGAYNRAEASFRQALSILPNAPEIWLALGQVLVAKREFRESETALRRALSLFEESKSAQAAVALNDLAVLYQAKRDFVKALEALELAAPKLGPGQARARVLSNLGGLHWKLGQAGEADSHFLLALREMEQSVGPHHSDVGRILDEYSVVLEKTGRAAEARQMRSRAQGIRSASATQTNSTRSTVDWLDLK